MLESRINSDGGKLSRRDFIIKGLAATAALLGGCKKSPYLGAPGISAELQNSWPIWVSEDLEINKSKGRGIGYSHEVFVKPEFYNGSMPLKYESVHDISGMIGGMSGPKICFRHQFDDFSNYFIYDSVWLKGAVAVNNRNTMVAEAKFEYVPRGDNELAVPKMEEFHYAGGQLVFHCMSELDNSTGFKIREMQQSGRKQRDYFFMMPIGINE